MKRLFLGTFIFIVALSTSYGQEYKKQLKAANKALLGYYQDAGSDIDALENAKAMIDQAFSMEGATTASQAWLAKGEIYNQIANAEMNKKILTETMGQSFDLATPDAGLIALDAFKNVLKYAVKKSETKDGLKGIRDNEDFTNNIAITYFQANDYNSAFKNFFAGVESYNILKAEGKASRLDDDETRNDHFFYTAAAGYLGDYKEQAVPLFKALYDVKYNQPMVYEALFSMTVDDDEAKALEYLDAGKKIAPDDSSLLFAEINYYLQENKLDVLIDKLKMAIDREPENVSVYTTLGGVYDQLNQTEREAGNIEKADEYFDSALEYYGKALEINPSYFDAKYSQGALFYNKAAGMIDQLNELGNDYSAAGTRKYNALKDEMDGYFNQALPYFIDAEKIDPTDLNVMIALREIYARAGDFEKSNEYKNKIEARTN